MVTYFLNTYISLDSCGFEHVFVGETRSGAEIIGFHNWIQFYLQEKGNHLDYKGYKARDHDLVSLKVYAYNALTSVTTDIVVFEKLFNIQIMFFSLLFVLSFIFLSGKLLKSCTNEQRPTKIMAG